MVREFFLFLGVREREGACEAKKAEEVEEGGFAGTQRLGIDTKVAITAIESVRRGTSFGVAHTKGLTN